MDRSKWDPAMYSRFLKERTRPAIDLAHRLGDLLATAYDASDRLSILDVGCGPGNSTAALKSMFRGAGLVPRQACTDGSGRPSSAISASLLLELALPALRRRSLTSPKISHPPPVTADLTRH